MHQTEEEKSCSHNCGFPVENSFLHKQTKKKRKKNYSQSPKNRVFWPHNNGHFIPHLSSSTQFLPLSQTFVSLGATTPPTGATSSFPPHTGPRHALCLLPPPRTQTQV